MYVRLRSPFGVYDYLSLGYTSDFCRNHADIFFSSTLCVRGGGGGEGGVEWGEGKDERKREMEDGRERKEKRK